MTYTIKLNPVSAIPKPTSSTQSKLFAVAITTFMSASCPSVAYACDTHKSDTKEKITNSYFLNIFKSQAYLVRNCEVIARKLGIEPPDESVMNKSVDFLTSLERNNIKTDFINPSHDGGIIIEFHKKNDYCLVEIFNDSDVVFLVRSEKSRNAWDYNHENFETGINHYLLQ